MGCFTVRDGQVPGAVQNRRWNKQQKKVMDMVISATNHEDVAEPDAMASGAAGTGQEHTCAAAAVPACSSGKKPGHRDWIVIGLGVLSPGTMAGPVPPEPPAQSPETPADDGSREEGCIDLIFALYERDERIAERLERKISRLEKRMDAIGKRGRS